MTRVPLIYLLLTLGVVCPGRLVAQDPWKDVYKESAWQERDSWQKPHDLIRLLGLSPGSRAADIGCHEGYMTVKLSKAVGASGRVYAVDVEESRLSRLKENLADRGIINVETIRGESNNPRLPSLIDGILILDAYHEMKEHKEVLTHILSALKPGGKLLICEAVADERKASPRSAQEGKHELGMNYALEDLTAAGFHIVMKQENFIDRTLVKGDRMWVVVAARPEPVR